MINPAETALKKIMTSYGQRAPMVTRVQAFAKAARLYHDIDARILYAGAPEHDRGIMMNLVQRYALLLRSEETLENSLAYYPLALSYAAQRAASRLDGAGTKIRQTIHDMTSLAAYLPGYADVFEEAYQEIAQNPENYPTKSISTFLKDVAKLQTGRGPLKSLFAKATGFLKDEFGYMLERLNELSYIHDHDEQIKEIKDYYVPREGPDNAEELLFMLAILYSHTESIFARKTPAYNDMQAGLADLYSEVNDLCSDMTDKHLEQFWQSRKHNMPSPLLRAAFIHPADAPQVAVAMTRHYLERHRDKIPHDAAIALNALTSDLYIRNYAHHQESLQAMGIPITDEAKQQAIDKMLYESWDEWPRPGVEELVQYYDARLKGKSKLRFHEILSHVEPHTELHVSYYAEQNESVRKLRRNLFRQDSQGGAQESYRAAFIKHLADEHAEDLEKAGFSPMAISFMARTGKMLPQREQEPAYNVDHIVDLYCGGTNHRENLCLMPAWLNEAKNDFLLLQTGIHTKNIQGGVPGGWIITLRPRKDENGNTPAILLDQTGAAPAARAKDPHSPESRAPR